MGKKRLVAYLFLLGAVSLWGVASPIIKYTLNGIDPFNFLAYRFSISAVLALMFFSYHNTWLPKNKNLIIPLIIYSFISTTLPLSLLFLGLDKSNVLSSTVLISTVPLVTALAGTWFLSEHITKREKKGMSLAFLGTMITIIEPVLKTNHNEGRLLGNIMIFAFILVDTYSYILAKKIMRKGISASYLTNFAFFIGFLTLTPVVFLKSPGAFIASITSLSFDYHLGVIYMAIFSGTIAFSLWNRGQRTIEVSEAAVFKYLDPLFAAPLAVLWLGEAITPLFILGAAVIACGVIIAETKGKNMFWQTKHHHR